MSMITKNDNRSTAELVGDAFGQLAKLIGNEFELARAELSQKVALIGKAAGLIGVGAVCLIPTLVILLMALAAALVSGGFTPPVAYLLAGIAGLVLSGLLSGIGFGLLRGDALKPKLTLDQIQRDQAAAKEMMK